MLGKKNEKVAKQTYSDRVNEQRERKEYKKRLAKDPDFASAEAIKYYDFDLSRYTKYGSESRISRSLALIRSYMGDTELIFGSMLTQLSNTADNNKIRMIGTMVEQNWVIIRQNEAILKNLEAMNRTK